MSRNAEYYKNGKIPWLKTKEVNYSRIYSTENHITELGLANSSAKLVPENSVIVAMYGDGNTAGRAAINKILLTTNQACCNLQIDAEKADFRFVYYALKNSYQSLVDLKNGGGQQNLNAQLIKQFQVPCPAIEVQRGVADALEAIDDRIEVLSETNRTLEAIAQAIFKSWFVDFDPVKAKAEGREPEGMDAATAALFPSTFEDSELGQIPMGWKAVPFGELLESNIGGDWGKEEPDQAHNTQAAIIRGADMPTVQRGYTTGIPVRFVTPKKLDARALRDGDIIIEVSGGSPKQPTGRSIFVTDALLEQFSVPVVPASFCRRFRAIGPAVSLFLAQHLSFIYGEGKMWGYQNQSTGISNFQTKHFLEAEYVCRPPDDVLDAFCQIVRPMVDRQQIKIADSLASLRDALLPKLMSGQIRVPINSQVEAEQESEVADVLC